MRCLSYGETCGLSGQPQSWQSKKGVSAEYKDSCFKVMSGTCFYRDPYADAGQKALGIIMWYPPCNLI